MRAVALVILLGLGIGALGLAAADLYTVGVLVLFIGVIGAVVVAGDRLIAAAGRRRPPAWRGPR
ncbi:MAG TPA: hypothetical protein VE343_01965 [Streptosporangiaceae bacterium]|jgi:hypothetical protein|nr:hypothetical protein [Streptosporangiaceae bacterium]